MLIDAHTHFFFERWMSKPYKQASAWRWALREGHNASEWPLWEKADEPDPDMTEWFNGLDYLGIDIAVNMVLDMGSNEVWGEDAPISIEEINRRNCLATQKYPSKVYTFIGVNPKRYNAVELLERGVREWGAKGLKLFPPMGFYPNDRVCYRIYEKCAELEVPITVHMGYGGFGYLKYANPIYLDEPARDFPELNFIIAHAAFDIGLPGWMEAVAVAAQNPNVYLELSQAPRSVIKGGTLGNKGKYKDHTLELLDRLDIIRNRALQGTCTKIIFGTDYPLAPIETLKAWVDLFKNLPTIAAQYGYDFSQEEADLICYKNAARIMKLDVPKMEGEK